MYGTGNDHFDEWVDSLATTTLPQGTGRLVTIGQETGKPIGYCCMGQACTLVPHLSLSINEEDTSDWDSPTLEGETVYDEVGYYDQWAEMAPPELLAHLGVEHDLEQSDIFVDLPDEYAMSQGELNNVALHGGQPISTNEHLEPRLGCSVLNDRYNLTFSQIADVLRYFGIMDTIILD
jgi:hypothetical protein